MELEIGCGNGEFLCSLARRNHETNFVGVEVKRKSAHEAVARASSAGLGQVSEASDLLRPFPARDAHSHDI